MPFLLVELLVGDFDADGATSSALLLLGLPWFGFNQVDFLVPNRFDFGYGLSPEIVDVAAEQGAQLLLTVDNGISSIQGVKRTDKPAFGFQGHPEASPGPHDIAYLFDQFMNSVKNNKK